MQQASLTRTVLRQIGKSAVNRDEYGVYIWASRTRFNEFKNRLIYDGTICTFVAEQLQRGNTLWVSPRVMSWCDFEREPNGPYEEGEIFDLAIPAGRLVTDDRFCVNVEGVCQRYPLKGPVNFLPSMYLF